MTESTEAAKRRIAQLAQSISLGTIDVLDGCREIVLERANLSLDDARDEALMLFVAVESELEDVPSPEGRSLWSPDSLRSIDEKAKAYLSSIHGELTRSCRSIWERWGAKS